jgi:putative transcriptional regulator
MSSAFESIEASLTKAVAHANGQDVKALVHYPKAIDVKAIRAQVGISQAEFASSFGISVGTLRHWERGDREPHGIAMNHLDSGAHRTNSLCAPCNTPMAPQ